MEKDRKFRALAIAAICVAIVGVSVAYAALTASLTITGTATVGSSWELKWKSVQPEAEITKSEGVIVTQAPEITGTGSNNIDWAATFKAPQTKLVFTAVFTNAGSMPAKLDSGTYLNITGDAFTTKIGPGETPTVDPFTYSVTVGGVDIQAKTGYILAAGKDVTVTVTVEFDKDNVVTNEQLLALNTKTAEFTLSLPWSQATDTEAASVNQF